MPEVGVADEQLTVCVKLGDWNEQPAWATPAMSSVTVMVQVTFWDAEVVLTDDGENPNAVKLGAVVSHCALDGSDAAAVAAMSSARAARPTRTTFMSDPPSTSGYGSNTEPRLLEGRAGNRADGPSFWIRGRSLDSR